MGSFNEMGLHKCNTPVFGINSVVRTFEITSEMLPVALMEAVGGSISAVCSYRMLRLRVEVLTCRSDTDFDRGKTVSAGQDPYTVYTPYTAVWIRPSCGAA